MHTQKVPGRDFMGGIANRECKNQTNVYMGANLERKTETVKT